MIQAGGPAPGGHVSRSGGPRSLPRPEGGVQAAVRSEAARETDLHCHPRQAGCPRASDSAEKLDGAVLLLIFPSSPGSPWRTR